MYIVSFKLKDNTTEEYFYHKYPDAEYHFGLFVGDNSELYSRVELLDDDNLLGYIDFLYGLETHT